MEKQALLVVAVLFGLCGALSAQEMARSGDMSSALLSMSQPAVERADMLSTLGRQTGFPLTLADGRLFTFANAFLGLEEPLIDFLPAIPEEEGPSERPAKKVAAHEQPAEEVPLVRPKFFDHVSGEVGVLYGRSVGSKYSGDLKQGYIFGEMDNGQTVISAAAFYQESSVHFPRRGR
jgi:hypothetical protein